jgi:hypothetical protein
MEPENQNTKHTTHTYSDDLAKAMDTTDAKVVQQLLNEGREREAVISEEKIIKKQKTWYSVGAIILIVATLASLLYSLYYYTNLTVPIKPVPSVGIFPNTETINSTNTDIRKVVESLKKDTKLEESRPTLVSITKDESSLLQLSSDEIFSFFESNATEPFLASFDIARLGVINIGGEVTTFIIASMTDTEISTKELLIAEPTLLRMFYKPLNINLTNYVKQIGKNFSGEYMYNIPTRVLRDDTVDPKKDNVIFFYAKVTDQIVVFTTKPNALKAIYDNLIRQNN